MLIDSKELKMKLTNKVNCELDYLLLVIVLHISVSVPKDLCFCNTDEALRKFNTDTMKESKWRRQFYFLILTGFFSPINARNFSFCIFSYSKYNFSRTNLYIYMSFNHHFQEHIYIKGRFFFFLFKLLNPPRNTNQRTVFFLCTALTIQPSLHKLNSQVLLLILAVFYEAREHRTHF